MCLCEDPNIAFHNKLKSPFYLISKCVCFELAFKQMTTIFGEATKMKAETSQKRARKENARVRARTHYTRRE